MATLGLRSCVARQEPYIPGALSILQGTVPGRVRGSGHMVPTYFRRELRDRALQRPLRLRTFVCVDFCVERLLYRLRHLAQQLSLRPSSRAMFGGTERCMTASASKADLRAAALAKR